MEEVKAYKTTDGAIFGSKKEAQSHQKTINKEKSTPKKTLKKTYYVLMNFDPTSRIDVRTQNKVIVVETKEDFTDPELHIKHEKLPWKEYELEKVEESGSKRTVFYKEKYSANKKLKMKLNADKKSLKIAGASKGTELLDETEIEAMLINYPSIHEEIHDVGEWTTKKTTVVQVGDKMYAVDWEEGLTVNESDWFDNAPYEVTLETETKVITVTNTIINKVEE